MLENQQHENINDLDEHFALNLMPDDELENSCSPIWMYNIGEAFADISATGQLPDGYATSVGYGHRFRNSEFLPLFTHYPIIIYLLILGIIITLAGIATAMMITANRNIRKAKAERRWRLKLADESVTKIIKKLDDINLTEPLENFKQLSLKFQHAVENATPLPLHGNMITRANEDFGSYKNDIAELLEIFSDCNAYLLHFLDSWRYYDTNATKFAKHVDTMESRYALESVRNVRTDFSNVVYKVIQQNRAFYHYHQGIHRSSAEMRSEQVFEKEETNLDLILENVKKKLGKIGKRLQEHSIRMKEAKENLRDAPKGAGYIEFADTLLGFGNFICIIILLIVFLSLLSMPLWYWGRFYCCKCEFVASVLPLTTTAVIFTFYLPFVLVIVYYFLYGMVARDGICGGKRPQALHRSNIIDDCLNGTAIFETDASAEYRIETGNIEAVLSELENLPHRMKRRSTPINGNRTSKFEIFHINKTIIQDIYVEMLKVSVYAPKNIEPFATLWQAHRLSGNRALRGLNCTHAIGNTMVVSLHGQIANEMDKLYRMTWRIESLLQDLPHRPQDRTSDSNTNFSSVFDLSRNLRRIFNKEREQLDRSVYRTSHSNVGSCKTVALLYKTLATVGCDCLVPSMNLYWFGALVAVCLISLLLPLLLCQEEMIRRKRSDSVHFAYIDPDGRRHSQTRSSSRPGTSHSTHNSYTPYSTRTGTPQSSKQEGSPHSLRHYSQHDMRNSSPYFERRSTLYSDHVDTPYASHTNTPYSTRATTPFSSHPETPYNSHPVSPHTSQCATPAPSRRGSSHSSYYGTPDINKNASPETSHSTRDKSIERTPTRGTSLALKLPPDNESFLSDYKRFGVEDPFVQQFTERLSRRDMLPRRQQRKQQYPSEAQHDLRDYSKYESFPESSTNGEGKLLRTLRPNKLHIEPRSVWKNAAFRYPGLASSDISANQPTRMPTSISKVIEQRAKSRSKHMSTQLIPQEEANVTILNEPTTSRANAQLQFPPGKIGIVVCPCGCGKPSKIYGTREDIERIRKAGHVCIAKRSAQLRNKHLRPLASVVQLEEADEGDEDMA
ncbi:uncharacterized protein LOC101451657 isoform X2 [Ceratitis capitata]|uniref:uncharacterized protein LOC101451657 isoform X2 n=1 Tax=Ceratitis capitata TaxID=7213 RepID=UPI000A0FE673|nr:uncharacterized protein LOC101451657 isoform X2 [Ceratitis capitata]